MGESPPASHIQDLERGSRSALNFYCVIFRIEYIYLTNSNCPTNKRLADCNVMQFEAANGSEEKSHDGLLRSGQIYI